MKTTLKWELIRVLITAVVLGLAQAIAMFCLYPIVGPQGVACGWITYGTIIIGQLAFAPWNVRVQNEVWAELERRKDSGPDSGGER